MLCYALRVFSYENLSKNQFPVDLQRVYMGLSVCSLDPVWLVASFFPALSGSCLYGPICRRQGTNRHLLLIGTSQKKEYEGI